MDYCLNPDAHNRELALLCDVRMQPAAVAAAVVAAFGDEEELAIQRAITWAWRERRVKKMSGRRAAELLGIRNSHLSNILSGAKYLPPQKLNQFEWICGNTAVSQTIAHFRDARERWMAHELAQIAAQYIGRVA